MGSAKWTYHTEVLSNYTSKYLLNKDVKNKLLRTNFIVVLNVGTTDAAVIKQVVIHVNLLDRDNFGPCLTFLTVADLNKSQDASGLKKAFLICSKVRSLSAY